MACRRTVVQAMRLPKTLRIDLRFIRRPFCLNYFSLKKTKNLLFVFLAKDEGGGTVHF